MLNADAAGSVVAQFRGNKWTVCVCVLLSDKTWFHVIGGLHIHIIMY